MAPAKEPRHPRGDSDPRLRAPAVTDSKSRAPDISLALGDAHGGSRLCPSDRCRLNPSHRSIRVTDTDGCRTCASLWAMLTAKLARMSAVVPSWNAGAPIAARTRRRAACAHHAGLKNRERPESAERAAFRRPATALVSCDYPGLRGCGAQRWACAAGLAPRPSS